MKLVTQLKLFGAFATLLVIILGVTTYWRATQVELAIERNNIAAEVVKEAFTLNILSDDYINTHGERAEIQWKSQHNHLNKSIASYQVESVDEKRIVDELQLGQAEIFAHFSQLVASPAATPLAQEAEKRLTGQLAVDMQKIVSLASNLADGNNTRLSAIRQTSMGVLATVLILLGVFLIVGYFLFARSISLSIERLTKGTNALASGDLSFRFHSKSRDEFGQLANKFDEMTAQLQQLDRAKDEFISLASHELRTPMTAIRGLISMIVQGDYGPISDRIKKPLTNINISTERQVHLINDLLNISRLQTGKIVYTLTNFPIQEVTKEVTESLQPIAQQKGITLTVIEDHERLVQADIGWVRQILNNIIGNALKFTDKGSVTISYRLTKDQILVVVSDTGVGIDQQDQKKLFKKFQQVNSDQSGKPDGAGLGLYISHGIAQKMGGDIWIEKSIPGAGSTFVISLPRSASLKAKEITKHTETTP